MAGCPQVGWVVLGTGGGVGYWWGGQGILVVIPKIVYQSSYKLFYERVKELLYESLGEIFLKKV